MTKNVSRIILKYSVPIDGTIHSIMMLDAQWAECVMCHCFTPDIMTFWMVVDPEVVETSMEFTVLGTAMSYGANDWEHLGSCLDSGSEWHLLAKMR